METYNISGVEVFSVGTWNGDKYTLDDLNEMVLAFQETKKGIPPYLKLGHDDNQLLIQKDGLPSCGWIENLYIRGDKLVADFSCIPKKIFELIKSKAYRKVSSEIYWNIKILDKTYKKLLGAVSLLGSDMPGVMNLNDIMGMYKLFGENAPKTYTGNELEFELKTYTENKEKGANTMSEEEKLKLEQLESENLKAKEALELKEKEIAELKEFKAAAQKKELELALEAEKAKKELFVNELISEKLCTPSMKNYMLEILGEEKKEYSVKENETLTKENLLKETLKLFKSAMAVNFEENSVKGDKDKDKSTEQDLIVKAEKYASENKVTFGQALKAIRLIKEKGE